MDKNVICRDVAKCLNCVDAPCAKICPYKVNPEKILRSLRFENKIGAMKRIGEECKKCSAPCEKSCVLAGYPVKKLMLSCIKEKEELKPTYKKANIKTDICGIELENPFLLSSSVVSSTYDMCKRAFEAGWAGAAFKTICMMDIHEASPRFSAIKSMEGDFVGFKNIEQLSDHPISENLEIFKRLKKEFPKKFLLVSIMGRNESEWASIAKAVEKTGADALELNFSCPNMTEQNTGSAIGQIPELVEKYTRAVTKAVKIPVIAKLTPNVASMIPAALAAKRGGASGIAAINTINSITEFDKVCSAGEKNPHMFAVGGLSGRAVKPIALRFVSELTQNKDLNMLHISAMGGIYTCEDAMMFLSLGAKSIQITTAVMEYGYRIIEDLVEGLEYGVAAKGYKSLKDMIGCNKQNLVDINKIERDVVVYPKFNRDKCLHCGRCFLSCRDGGHQAIKFDDNRMPILDASKCVGCHLCVLVCPNNAIVSSEMKIKKNK